MDRSPDIAAELAFGHEETILLVDDDPTVCSVLRFMLEHLHYHVLTASGGQEALTIYAHHHDTITLVLTDFVMLEMNGEALFHALRQRDPKLKVVVLTGFQPPEKVFNLLAQGVIAVLQKPFRLAALAREIQQAMRAFTPPASAG